MRANKYLTQVKFQNKTPGILHILPESLEVTAHARLFIILAFIVFYFLEHHLLIHAGHEDQRHINRDIDDCHEDCCSRPHPMGLLALVGMGLHALIDAVIIGTSFEVGHDLGLLSALGVIAHEVPGGGAGSAG